MFILLIMMIIVIGMCAGWIAQMIVEGSQKRDWAEALIVGLLGSFVGGTLSTLLFSDEFEIRPAGFIGATIGATLILAVRRFIRGPQPAAPKTHRNKPHRDTHHTSHNKKSSGKKSRHK